jgi:two-component system, OmpR family, response regulator MprA
MTGTGNGAARILVVDDDPRIAAALRRALTYEGYRVEVAADGPAALLSARERPPDLVVLDVMLPGLDGVEVCRRLRAGGEVAILMLTARDATGDRVRGLDSGADDYLTKPFATEELLARVRALLRRLGSRQPADAFLRYEEIALDPAAREVRRGERPVALTALEFDLLLCFLRHPRQVLTREQLLDAVWGSDVAITSNAVDVYVGYLRGKLEADGEPRLIQTVRGVGYVLRTSPGGERSAAR